MWVKKYLGYFLFVVAIGFVGKQAVANEGTGTVVSETVPGEEGMGNVVSTTPASSVAKVQSIKVVSVTSAGQTGNDNSPRCGLSGDGRYVVFSSAANNLVDGDTNGRKDIFIYDRNADSGNGIERISVDKDNISKGGNRHSGEPAISADGRYVVFSSAANNLVESSGKPHGGGNIFVYDLEATSANRIQRISVDKDNTSKEVNGNSVEPAISSDGRYVAFVSDASNLIAGDSNGRKDIFLYDRDADSGNGIERISVDNHNTSKGGNGHSYDPAVSADGRYVVFTSEASNLIAGDANGKKDIFIYDRDADSGNGIERISVDNHNTSKGGNNLSINPAISADGRYVVFVSSASNLITGDTNGQKDIFIYDRNAESGNGIERISVDKDDMNKGGKDNSYNPAISADGRYVVFESYASNLIDGDTNGKRDIFIYDRNSAKISNGIQRISVRGEDTSTGGNRHSGQSVISADGRYVAFVSSASNLVDGDSNDKKDVFIAAFFSDDAVMDEKDKAKAGKAKATAAKGQAAKAATVAAAQAAATKAKQGVEEAATAAKAARAAATGAPAGSAVDKAATAAEAAALAAAQAAAETAKILATKAETLAVAAKTKAQAAKGKADGAQDQASVQQALEAAKAADAEANKAKGFAQAAKGVAAAAQAASTDAGVQRVAAAADTKAGTATQSAGTAKALDKLTITVAVGKFKEYAEAGLAKATAAKGEAAKAATVAAAQAAATKAKQGVEEAAAAAKAARAAAAGATAGSAVDKAAALAAAQAAAATANSLATKAKDLANAAKDEAQAAKGKADAAQDTTTAEQAVDGAKAAAAKADKAKGFAEAAKSSSTAADDKSNTAMQTANTAKGLAGQAIAAAVGKFKEYAEAGKAKAAEAKGQADKVATVAAAQAVATKAKQGVEQAAAAATAARAAATGAPAGSVADKAAVAAEAAALAAAQAAAATANSLATKAKDLANAAKDEAQAAKGKADAAQDTTTAEQAVDDAKTADVNKYKAGGYKTSMKVQQAVESAKAADAEADKAKGFAQAAKEVAAATKAASTDAGVQQAAAAADKIAGTAMQTADMAKNLVKQVIADTAGKFKEDAEAGQAKIAKAEGEAAKGIPDFSMGGGVLMVMLMAFIAIKRPNKTHKLLNSNS